jgi:hypothetical protein
MAEKCETLILIRKGNIRINPGLAWQIGNEITSLSARMSWSVIALELGMDNKLG